MSKNTNTKVILAIVAIIVIALAAFLLTRHQVQVIVPKAYFNVPPGEPVEYNVTVALGHSAILSGEFVSANNLEVAVLNDTQFIKFMNFITSTKFNKTYDNLSSAVQRTFNATDSTNGSTVVVDVVYAKISSGRYHLLFYNPNPEYLIGPNLTYWAGVSMATPIVLNYTN